MDNGEQESTHYTRRPPNAFIIFCMKNRVTVRKYHPKVENRTISKILGEWWKDLELEHKVLYRDLEEKNRNELKATYPDFKWCRSSSSLITRHDCSVIISEELPDKSQREGLSNSLSDGGHNLQNYSAPKPPRKLYLQRMPELQESTVDCNKDYKNQDSVELNHDIGSRPRIITFSKTICFGKKFFQIKRDIIGSLNVRKLERGSSIVLKLSSKVEVKDTKCKIEVSGQNLAELKSSTLDDSNLKTESAISLHQSDSPENICKVIETSQQKIIDCVVDREYGNFPSTTESKISSNSTKDEVYRRSRRLSLKANQSNCDIENCEHTDKMKKYHVGISLNDDGMEYDVLNGVDLIKIEEFDQKLVKNEVETDSTVSHPIKVEPDFQNNGYSDDISNFFITKLKKSIEELPPPSFEKFRRRRKEKRLIKKSTPLALGDHDYSKVFSEYPRKKCENNSKSINLKNNAKYVRVSKEKPFPLRKTSSKNLSGIFDDECHNSDEKIVKIASNYAGNKDSLNISTPVNQHTIPQQEMRQNSFQNGSRKRKAPKEKIKRLGSEINYTGASAPEKMEAAMTLIALAEGLPQK